MDLTNTKAMLDCYYTETGRYIDGEEEGTTVVTIGCSVMTSILAGTRSPKVIAAITGLPIAFVAAVLSVTEAGAPAGSGEQRANRSNGGKLSEDAKQSIAPLWR